MDLGTGTSRGSSGEQATQTSNAPVALVLLSRCVEASCGLDWSGVSLRATLVVLLGATVLLAGACSSIEKDFMGSTVAGPDHFLGRPHPGEGNRDAAPNLGLIQSADGGRSWTSVSLNGETDFHILEYRHGLVYGLDSGSRAVMVSGTALYREATTSAAQSISPRG